MNPCNPSCTSALMRDTMEGYQRLTCSVPTALTSARYIVLHTTRNTGASCSIIRPTSVVSLRSSST
jgi:hypothetical protein